MRTALLLLLTAVPLAAEQLTPIGVLLKNKKAYDRKFCCIAGKTATLFTKVSRHANPYFTVWLFDGNDKIKVFAFGKPPFSEGERIEACGVFAIQHEVSTRVFYDELSAKVILRTDAIGKDRVVLTPTDVRLVSTKP